MQRDHMTNNVTVTLTNCELYPSLEMQLSNVNVN